MKKALAFIAVFFTLLYSGCEKGLSDCEDHNYGILKVSFNSGTYRHRIYVTNSSTLKTKTKICNIGTMSDTLHLNPGAFVVSISSIDMNGLPEETQNISTRLSRCNESSVTIDF